MEKHDDMINVNVFLSSYFHHSSEGVQTAWRLSAGWRHARRLLSHTGLTQCGPGTANLASTLPGGIWVPVMAETHRGKQTDTTEFVSLKYEYQALLRMQE